MVTVHRYRFAHSPVGSHNVDLGVPPEVPCVRAFPSTAFAATARLDDAGGD